jgi:hypothetical protein
MNQKQTIGGIKEKTFPIQYQEALTTAKSNAYFYFSDIGFLSEIAPLFR